MGNFYTSFTVRSTARDKILEVMKGRKGAVSPTHRGYTVVWDAECESQDDRIISVLGLRMAKTVAAPVMAALNHDDDVLMFWLYSPEGKIGEYNSAPGYFEGEDQPPSGADAELFVKIMVPCATDDFRKDLLEPTDSILQSREYVFAFERHRELLAATGLPIFAATGYKYISRGEVPEGITIDQLTLTD